MNEGKHCDTCAFAQKREEFRQFDCRRRAPVHEKPRQEWQTVEPIWPRVTDRSWCGEWQEKRA